MSGWIGKQFTVVNQSDPRRRIGLTLALDGTKWTASDPRGIISPDDGGWRSNNINTECNSQAGTLIIMLVGCGMANVGAGQSGVAEVKQASAESFQWTCDRIIES